MIPSPLIIRISDIAHDITSIHAHKKNFRTHYIPIIALIDRNYLNALEVLIAAGIDDYVILPTTETEISSRTTLAIQRAERDHNTHPLTKLPGNTLIQRTVTKHLASPLALFYIDLDNFKAYNDYYGFAAGDNVLIHTATTLATAVETHGTPNDFLGHLGGDDFIIISTPEKIDFIAQAVCQNFDANIGQFYQPDDLLRKSIVVPDRRGIMHTYPLLAVSGAIVTNEHRTINGYAHIAQLAAELKKYAQTKPNGETGSNYVKDRRRS